MHLTRENDVVTGSDKGSPQDIADTLRGRIRGGELKKGDKLPTQAQLAEEFGVERGTVRQALRILQQDGLLSNTGKGSPPRVAEAVPEPDVPQPTTAILHTCLKRAFETRDVLIDVICFTAETLILALAEPLRLIHEGRLRPESIRLRCLVPARGLALAFPVPVEEADAPRAQAIHRELMDQRDSQLRVLRSTLMRLTRQGGNRVADVRVTYRELPFTTPVKLYLLNGEEAVFGYYQVGERPRGTAGGEIRTYDVSGHKAMLFPFPRSRDGRDGAFAEESQKWFDALWETIATDLTPSE
ncbi:GntR family transcriptional regulator [Streptomyces sp. NPDC057623]|uniref:GntR family transcriptional regulator n=1 Tax=Streptomyces sp. NPDC057623 TaxID=3346187 RepID=UPI0036B34C85